MTDEAPVDPPKEVTAGELVAASIASTVASLKEHEPGVRAGRDPDHVRKARVAVRRLRSNLRSFDRLLRREAVEPLSAELAALAGALGGVRDREVLAARLEADAKLLQGDDRAIAKELAARLGDEIQAARVSAVAFLDSERARDLLANLEALAAEPPLTDTATEPAVALAPGIARPPFDRLRRAVRRLPRNPADTELHKIRILAKRSRYAAQAVEPAMGEPAHQFAAAAAELQGILGEHQDAVTTENWLAALEVQGRAAFVAGRLAGLERAAAVAARGRWRAAWKALSAPHLGAWLETGATKPSAS